MRSDNILLLNWKAKSTRNVVMISTYHVGNETQVVVRQPRGAANNIVKKPVSVMGYNSSMGGVDLSDQLSGYYSFCRKSIKWWIN
ncbi:hypothetical protein SNE40_009740 [Patella caerulea]|uniref:PiggyBac transposable element-derived protein domain-containing protein n=1 Tax=Patella caerulea TaxID=87958 RepID=A0AAN8Q3M7_PATCE